MNNLCVVFVSNYFNHHQKSLSDAFYTQTKGNYWFIATSHISEERRRLGYKASFSESYILQYADCPEKCDELILKADVVIIGSAPEKLIVNRIRSNKLTFRYSERLYKKELCRKNYLHHAISAWLHHGRFQKYQLHMLCASAYTPVDCAKFKNYTERCYQWGYFPETKIYMNTKELIEGKRKNTILWAGRFLDLKHPDDAVLVASRLKAEGYNFELNIIGTGDMEPQITEMIAQYDLLDCVNLLGSMKPEQVRKHMEQSQIYLLTSDRNEGWGAVLNESMNSGCAVIASHAVGSVPFLLQDSVNGLIYESGNVNMLFEKTKYLLDNPHQARKLGEKAYQTIANEWNAGIATERFINFVGCILSSEKNLNPYKTGPCSKADILKDNWYKYEKN